MLKKAIVVLASVLFISSCMPGKTSVSIPFINDEKSGVSHDLSKRNYGRNILGLASFKEFESSSKVKAVDEFNDSTAINLSTGIIKNSDDVGNRNIKFSYPFDYVKIHSATKFDLYIPEDNDKGSLEALELSTGLGHLEVTIADFTTYIKEDNMLNESVTDMLISIRGTKGLYTILLNSYARGDKNNYENGHKYWVFSSHKVLTSHEIEKDFEPPIYSIMLEITDDNQYFLSFIKDDTLTSINKFFEYRTYLQFSIDTSTLEKVSRDTMYSVLDLNSLLESEQIVRIMSIDSEFGLIQVEGDSELKCIYIDEFTEFNNEVTDLDELLNQLSEGVLIEVRYDNYYEGYNPIYVYANSILFVLEISN